jgi:Fic family protein
MNTYQIPKLPLSFDIETKAVMKKTALARGALAEMKGVALSIPNEKILINTLTLQEARDSSAIENIVTTQDELFQSDYSRKSFRTVATKEVYNYAHALLTGFEELKKTNLLTLNQMLNIQSLLEDNRAGFRRLPGTELKNDRTGETVYTPPQIYSQDLLNNIFKHPYTKIDFVINDLGVSRLTATRYLAELTKIGVLRKEKIWKDNYYINNELFSFLSNFSTNHV